MSTCFLLYPVAHFQGDPNSFLLEVPDAAPVPLLDSEGEPFLSLRAAEWSWRLDGPEDGPLRSWQPRKPLAPKNRCVFGIDGGRFDIDKVLALAQEGGQKYAVVLGEMP
jgi:hypothetical protein